MRNIKTAPEYRAKLERWRMAYRHVDECHGSDLRKIFSDAHDELDDVYRQNCDPSHMYMMLDRDVSDGYTLEEIIDAITTQERPSTQLIDLCVLIARIMTDCGDNDADEFIRQAYSDFTYMSRNKLFESDETRTEYEFSINCLMAKREADGRNYWQASSSLRTLVRCIEHNANLPAWIDLMPRCQLACINDDIDDVHAIIDDQSNDANEPDKMYQVIRCAFEYFCRNGYLKDAMELYQRRSNLYAACSDTLYDIDKVVFKVNEYEYLVAIGNIKSDNQTYKDLMAELEAKHQTKYIKRINIARRKVPLIG